jgi:hypothetical protein
MCAALVAGLLLTSVGNGPYGQRAADPVVEEQPLESADFALIHTNDTRGLLDSCG